jgi:hypothetical protein
MLSELASLVQKLRVELKYKIFKDSYLNKMHGQTSANRTKPVPRFQL